MNAKPDEKVRLICKLPLDKTATNPPSNKGHTASHLSNKSVSKKTLAKLTFKTQKNVLIFRFSANRLVFFSPAGNTKN